MVDADHTQASNLASACQGDGNSRLVKGSSDRIHRERVVGVGTMIRSYTMVSGIPEVRKWDPYVSALTSQMTDKRRFGDVRVSGVMKGGICALR